MEDSMKCGFSENGQYFVTSKGDGKLKVWDTESGLLKQEYTPNLHLSSPLVSFVWVTLSPNPVTPRKKSRTSSDGGLELHTIALGTGTGQILVYSVSSNDIVATLGGGSSYPVNSLSWVRGSNLYSCAGQMVLEWTVSGKAIKSKWKADKDVIKTILVLPEGKGLLSATRSITLWTLPGHEKLKTFTGHATDVCSLVYIPPTSTSSNSYFISAGKSDRYLSAWTLSSEKQISHVAQFIMEDPIITLSVCSGEPNTVAAVLRNGVLHIYHVQLNGKCQKPLKPNLTIKITSESSQNRNTEKVVSIPILGGMLHSPTSVHVAYGTEPFIAFEKITPKYKEKVLCLVRQEVKKAIEQKKRPSFKVMEPEVGEDVQYSSRSTEVMSASKRGRKPYSEVPMEVRLNNLTMNRLESSKVPHADNVAHLLMQGLQSKDKKLMRNALHKSDETIIKRTVSRLPIQIVISLIEELASFMHEKDTRTCRVAAQWLRAVLTIQGSQILSCPGIMDHFAPVVRYVEERMELLNPLLRLRGRTELLMEQLASAQTVGTEPVNEESLLVYQDSYSSDDENLEDEILENNEFDENWDEFSEVDEVEESEKDDREQDHEMSVE